MIGRRKLAIAWLAVVALMAGGLAPRAAAKESAPAPRRPPNVLLIIADDLDNSLGCYGHPIVQTPHLDRLAERGMRFDRAYCQDPLCNPSRVSFLSGLRPRTSGVRTLFVPPRQALPNALFLPQCFRQAGYYTAHVGKIYHTGEKNEGPRSWDREVRETGKYPPDDQIIEKRELKGPRTHELGWAVLNTPDEKTPDGVVARTAVEMMEQGMDARLAARTGEPGDRGGKPFFLAVGFRRPHAPFAAPKRYFDLYPIDKIPAPAPPPAGWPGALPAALNHLPPQTPLTERETREAIAAYYASVSFIDAQVGVLMDAMDRLKL